MNNKLDTDINYIIQLSLKGDKKYQEILLDKLKPLICKNIYLHWNYNDPLVEDLLQEGYIVVLNALNSFDKNKDAHFLAFIKSKLKYFYMNYHRNNIKSLKYLATLRIPNKCYIADLEDSIEKKILKNEEINLLMKCINKLSEEEQQIIYSYYFDEIAMDEIARSLSLSYRATTSKKSRVIKKLKKCVVRRWGYGRYNKYDEIRNKGGDPEAKLKDLHLIYTFHRGYDLPPFFSSINLEIMVI